MLKDIEADYLSALTDLKYKKALALLELIPNDDYVKLCETHEDLFTAVVENSNNLHDSKVLDDLIAVFTDYIQQHERNLEKMDADELYMYITENIENLDTERLRGIAKVIKSMLGL